MTIASVDTIDLVVVSPDGATLCLVIVATEPLTSEGGYLGQFAAKLQNYHDAITSGFVDREYPEHRTAKKSIRVEHYSAMTPEAEEILTRWGARLSPLRIGLCSLQNSFNPFKILSSLFSRKDLTRTWTS